MRSKWKILFLCGFVLMGLAGCSAPRGTDGKTKVDQIIASEKIEIPKSQVNTTEIGDETLKKEYGKLKDSDTITIEPTGFGATLSQSWFDGLIVWPIAQLINVFASWTDAGVGIILATLLIQLVVFAFTYKSQLASQRMQEIQPELTRIQNKYKDKTDDRSRMLMAQETQKIYQKYDIHPFGTILVTFIQLPIMMGMYYATMRASAVVYGSFLGMSLSETPIEAFKSLGTGSVQWGPIIIYLLMIVMQIVSLKLPQWLKKYDDKKNGVRRKKYLKENDNPMASTMNMTMYFTTAMIAFMYLSWPIAMSFYWFVSSCVRSLMQLYMHFVLMKKQQKKAA
ncbi:YidC/Oxa1 family membrane protein insertase [Faecalibaculum rodentium]|jgi:YidC/Oxa1 family membrane protein insertase|uniref:Preprotein translocase YidC n=2 Tax=Faecalibaculum rodentium TaxID=1702221 RepID=A0A140DZ50_9FIRM|nr:YidC/Oxa1 family membrane protein insertase [Faecalibaculum rodentium]AMK55927.1 protein translocase subunit yidC [Faecalibaculum rodentium]OLU47157.1 preprotein translocase YidC [Faecalibaculum rodentium]